MKRLTAAAIIIIVVILVSAVWYTQTYEPKPTPITQNPTPNPTLSQIVNASSSPTPKPRPTSVTGDLNVTYSSADSDIVVINGVPSLPILINGTITNNGANTAYNVGLAASADTSMTQAGLWLTHALNTTIPIVSGTYDANGRMLSDNGSTVNVSFSNLAPNQSVTVSIAVYAHAIRGLINVRVNPVWSDTP